MRGGTCKPAPRMFRVWRKQNAGFSCVRITLDERRISHRPHPHQGAAVAFHSRGPGKAAACHMLNHRPVDL